MQSLGRDCNCCPDKAAIRQHDNPAGSRVYLKVSGLLLIFRSLFMSSKLSKPRSEAFRKQAGLCYYCQKPIWLDDKEGFAVQHAISAAEAERFRCTAEHLKARCDGGGDEQSNIVAACLFCNQARHQRKRPPSPSQYKEHVQRRLNKGKWHPKSLQHLAAHR